MNKILAVARAEYFIAATSKAFIIGVIMMPVFMGGALLVQHLTSDQVDISARRIAIVDQSNRLFETIEQRAELRNRNQIFSTGDEDARKQIQPEFLVEQVSDTGDTGTDEKRLDVLLVGLVQLFLSFGKNLKLSL